MSISNSETIPIRAENDVVVVRQRVRVSTQQLGFSLVDQTKMVTAASELARNTLIHGGGGELELEILQEDFRRGLRLSFNDKGKGIPDIDMALKDGFTTRGGLGLGLGGAKRLCNDFEIVTRVGEGTSVKITRWKG